MKFFLVLLAGFAIGAVAEHYVDLNRTCEALDGQQQHTISNPFNFKGAT